MLSELGMDPELNNYVFLGEAGCGKSEIAVNLAVLFSKSTARKVRFFDLDMTKPLFRSRDLEDTLKDLDIEVRYESQFMDAPTQVGGVKTSLLDADSITILDVGGDHIGARLIGGYAPYLRSGNTEVFYIVNPFRPWSMTLEHINGVLSQILAAAHIPYEKIKLIANPNLGEETTAEDVLSGWKTLESMVHVHKPFSFCAVDEKLIPEAGLSLPVPVFPIKRYMAYPWSGEPDTEC